MRWFSVVLVPALISGCASSEAPDEASGEPTPGEDTPRTGRGGSGIDAEGPEEPPQVEITVLDESLQIRGPGSASFDVAVPANLTKVSFVITSKDVLMTFELKVALEGCGSYSSGGSQGTFGPGGTWDYPGPLCNAAEPGPRSASVSAGAATYIDGSFKIRGYVPAEAPAPAT